MTKGSGATSMQRACKAGARGALLAFGAVLLAGCLRLGPTPPERLFTLTPAAMAPAGAATDGDVSAGLAVLEPTAAQSLTVTRVPVIVDDSSLAYLKEAFWVERPARLFQRLLAETIRARGNRLVLTDDDLQYSAPTKLSGTLVELGYDAARSSVVARYDGVLQLPDGRVLTRRFESTVPGITPEAAAVGPALNQAANEVAGQVAEWVG